MPIAAVALPEALSQAIYAIIRARVLDELGIDPGPTLASLVARKHALDAKMKETARLRDKLLKEWSGPEGANIRAELDRVTAELIAENDQLGPIAAIMQDEVAKLPKPPQLSRRERRAKDKRDGRRRG
jgi:hypothetical protein